MTREEFHDRFRGQMLLVFAEAWSLRKLEPTKLGMVMDGHSRHLDRLMDEMFDALTITEYPGRANGTVRTTNGKHT